MRFADIPKRGDFAMVDTVLLEGVDIMKSAAEEDAAMIKGFECPGECSLKTRVVFFVSSSLMLTGLKLKILVCFKGDFFFVSFIVVVVGRVFVVIGDMSSEEFAARGVAS